MGEHQTAVDALVDSARQLIARVRPADVVGFLGGDGVLVDIRPHAQRVREGEVPGAVVIERNVLEWRLDPAAPTCVALARQGWEPVVVMCSEGYASSLAAAALVSLGRPNVADLAGGFRAWRDEGLPTVVGGTPAIP